MTDEGLNQQVDSDGVLNLIQSCVYNYVFLNFEVTYFNRQVRQFDIGSVIHDKGWGEHPTESQVLKAKKRIEEYSLKNWKRLMDGVIIYDKNLDKY